MAATKKLILFLGQPEAEIVSNVQKTLHHVLAPSEVVPQVVWARDGVDAALKIENQKFDAVVIDTQASRLREGNFLGGLGKHKSTGKADIIAILPSHMSILPHELENASQILQKPYDLDTLVRALSKALATPVRVESKPESSFAVDVRVLNGLLKSTVFICQQFGLGAINMKKPIVRPANEMWKGDIGASIDIQSRLFQGALLISFEKSSYLKMYETMLGEVQTELNAENSEAIGEISNMILGNAKSEFTNYDISMTLPKALKAGESFPYPPGSASILIHGSSESGQIYVEVVAFALRK